MTSPSVRTYHVNQLPTSNIEQEIAFCPRQTHDCDAAVLVRRHLPGFLARLEESGQGPLPEFVKAELEGFAVRTACRQCGDELRAVPAVDGGRRVEVHAEGGLG